MKTIIYLFLMFFMISSLFSQDNKVKKLSQAKDDGSSYFLNTNPPPVPFNTTVLNPYGAVPTLKTFADYVTNGNTLRKLFVLGDTVALQADYLDTNFTNLNERRMRYNVSYDGGNTWGTDILVVNTAENQAYGEISPLIISNLRSVGASGRMYSGGLSRGFGASDLQLGLGSFTNTINPLTGRDYFSQNLGPTSLAGSYLSQTNDTLFFAKYNVLTSTFGSLVVISAGAAEVEATVRHLTTTASNGQNVFVMWSYGTAGSERYLAKESTDGGTSFGSLITILPTGAMVAGDSVAPWVCMDIIYKPGTTTKCAVFTTATPGTSITRIGYKILFWSPAINGGNPVVIADWHTTSIPLLNGSTYTGTELLQTNCTYVSNPTLAYTNDGSRLICVFQAGQVDTTSYGYHYFDIYSSYSDDNGATWSAPINITNTPNIDEIYPILSKTSNTSTIMNLSFMVSECPGSNSFTQTATPRCPNYWVYRKYNPVTGFIIGVKTISNEIPKTFSLQQNYPNPFNPSTKIRFELPKNDNISLKVYDLLGKEVATIVNNEFTTAGVKEVEFNASNLASGIYYYVLKAGDFTETKKMALVK